MQNFITAFQFTWICLRSNYFSKADNGILPSRWALLKASLALLRSHPFSVKHLKTSINKVERVKWNRISLKNSIKLEYSSNWNISLNLHFWKFFVHSSCLTQTSNHILLSHVVRLVICYGLGSIWWFYLW